eukprot:3940349-Rhodomonas_salina.1
MAEFLYLGSRRVLSRTRASASAYATCRISIPYQRTISAHYIRSHFFCTSVPSKVCIHTIIQHLLQQHSTVADTIEAQHSSLQPRTLVLISSRRLPSAAPTASTATPPPRISLPYQLAVASYHSSLP